MQKKVKQKILDLAKYIRKSPILSYWRTILFIILTIVLFVILYLKFDFKAFVESIKLLSWQAIFWLIALSFCEQFLSWSRYRCFLKNKSHKHFFDYVSVSTIGTIIPPKPLGLYYRFLLSMHLFKTKVKNTLYLVAVDTGIETIFIILFAILSLFVFPHVDLGFEIILYILGVVGIGYVILSFYETRMYLIRNKVLKAVIEYLVKIKEKVVGSFCDFLKKNRQNIVIASVLTLLKLLIGVLKTYLLFCFFGLEINFWICFGLWGIAFFVGTGSSLPGGLGAFELSFIYLAKKIGVPETLALNVAILERIFHIWIWGVFTGVYLFAKQTNIKKIHEYFLDSLLNLVEKVAYVKTIKAPPKKLVKKISKNIKSKIRFKNRF